ncbi:MAG: heat-inducible transcription repressor HrcA [Chloroflexi bacterium]|nr:MAG: heat-inducible transcription repressor HrcA [Chloroflexota bacterium]PIE80110.1 MAG: heat-inducible transcription repressor HrcA [Chloroflexota bacterium]
MFQPLTERQERILDLVIRTYIETGLPVSSNTLVDRFEMGVSSATVRNELAALGELGYLVQLHTSAGRTPTELGYRYFVQKLLGEFRLPVHEQQMIRHQFHQSRLDLNQWMQLAAAILAHTSQGASFVTAPQWRVNRFKHIQLISTQGCLVLMIVVLVGGEVTQQMLTLAEPLPQMRLSTVADRLNEMFANAGLDEIQLMRSRLDTLESEVTDLILDVIKRVDSRAISNFYRDGLVNLLEDEGTRQAVRVLEERSLLADVISGTDSTNNRGVQVLIGGEGRWEELKDCTIILSRYGVVEQFSGTVAVIGPTRMPYGHNVAAVRYVANLMSDLVYDYYLEGLPEGISVDEEVNP